MFWIYKVSVERLRLRGCAILTVMAASPKRPDPLKPAGFLLLIMGWILVLSAIILLKQLAQRGGFAMAGLAVEALGLFLVVRSHIAPKPERN
jgi:hypothetical protein